MHEDTLGVAVFEQRQSLLRRVAALRRGQWELPAAVPAAGDQPGRTVRDVVAHLIVVDEMAIRHGGPRAWTGMRRLEHPGCWDADRIAQVAALPTEALVALLARQGERFGRVVSGAPAPVRRLPVRSATGRRPLADLVARRVLHEWLHEHDIATATDGESRPMSMPVAVAEVVAGAVLRLLPADVLPRAGIPDGVVRLVVLIDPGEGSPPRRCIWGVDFGRRQYGPRVLRPAAATVRLDAAALALLVHGRGDRLASGSCPAIDGDRVLGRALLDALRAPGTSAPCPTVPAEALAS